MLRREHCTSLSYCDEDEEASTKSRAGDVRAAADVVEVITHGAACQCFDVSLGLSGIFSCLNFVQLITLSAGRQLTLR